MRVSETLFPKYNATLLWETSIKEKLLKHMWCMSSLSQQTIVYLHSQCILIIVQR